MTRERGMKLNTNRRGRRAKGAVMTAEEYRELIQLHERWFAELTNKWLRRSAHRSVAELRAAIEHWLATWNCNPRTFIWTKSADQILSTIASYCQRINDSER